MKWILAAVAFVFTLGFLVGWSVHSFAFVLERAL